MSNTYQNITSIEDIGLYLDEEYLGMKIQATVFLDTLVTGSIASRYYITNKIAAHDFHFELSQTILDFIGTYWMNFTRLVVYYEDNENHLKVATQQEAYTIQVLNAGEVNALATPDAATVILTTQQPVTNYYEVKENAVGQYVYTFYDQYALAKTFAANNFTDLVSGYFTYIQKSALYRWDISEHLYFVP